jgi:hypothetical protein
MSKSERSSKFIQTAKPPAQDLKGLSRGDFKLRQGEVSGDKTPVPSEVNDRLYLAMIDIIHKDIDELTTIEVEELHQLEDLYDSAPKKLVLLRGLQSEGVIYSDRFAEHKDLMQVVANLSVLFSHIVSADKAWLTAFDSAVGFDTDPRKLDRINEVRMKRPEWFIKTALQNYKKKYLENEERQTLETVLQSLIEQFPFIKDKQIFKVRYTDEDDREVRTPAHLHTREDITEKDGFNLDLIGSGGKVSDYVTKSVTHNERISVTEPSTFVEKNSPDVAPEPKPIPFPLLEKGLPKNPIFTAKLPAELGAIIDQENLSKLRDGFYANQKLVQEYVLLMRNFATMTEDQHILINATMSQAFATTNAFIREGVTINLNEIHPGFEGIYTLMYDNMLASYRDKSNQYPQEVAYDSLMASSPTEYISYLNMVYGLGYIQVKNDGEVTIAPVRSEAEKAKFTSRSSDRLITDVYPGYTVDQSMVRNNIHSNLNHIWVHYCVRLVKLIKILEKNQKKQQQLLDQMILGRNSPQGFGKTK